MKLHDELNMKNLTSLINSVIELLEGTAGRLNVSVPFYVYAVWMWSSTVRLAAKLLIGALNTLSTRRNMAV